MSTTARALITTAFNTIGSFASGETIPTATDEADAFARLNALMASLKLQPLASPTNVREVFTLTANKGGPTNPYTIGPSGADFTTTRPSSDAELVGVGLILGGTSPALEIPRAIFTDDAYEGVQVKDLGGSLFTGVYYNPTYASGKGTINLWPVPDNADNSLVLYRNLPVATFTSVTASVDIPDGYEDALAYELARRLLTPCGIVDPGIVADVQALAATSMANVKRANIRLTDLATDPALTHDRRGGYNINTGAGG